MSCVMANEKLKSAKFRFVGSAINQFAVFEENYKDNCEINVKSQVKFEYLVADHVVCCESTATGVVEDRPIVRASMSFKFELSDATVNDLTNTDEGTVVIPRELLSYFGNTTYGALRGAVIAKLEPTRVRLLLPMIDLSRMIEKSMVVNI